MRLKITARNHFNEDLDWNYQLADNDGNIVYIKNGNFYTRAGLAVPNEFNTLHRYTVGRIVFADVETIGGEQVVTKISGDDFDKSTFD